ncbi:MAG: hypothetical protein H6713_37435 [Myxococcales bacterium]|nr:hypothetical protein [Myxococcales bacterium]MCB9755648.1 hypothetical protein [Myxococcales bacterium]
MLAITLAAGCGDPDRLEGEWLVSSIAGREYPTIEEHGSASVEQAWSLTLDAPDPVDLDARARARATGTLAWRERYSFHSGGERQDVLRRFAVELLEDDAGELVVESWPAQGDPGPAAPQLRCDLPRDDELRCVDERARPWLWTRL